MSHDRERTLLFLVIYIGLGLYGLVWMRFPDVRGMVGDRFALCQAIIIAAMVLVSVRCWLELKGWPGKRFSVVWMLADICIITLIVRLAGGIRSDAATLYVLPIVTAAAAGSELQSLTAGVAGVGLYAWATMDHDLEGPEPAWLMTRLVILAVVTILATYYARHEGRRVEEMAGLRERVAVAEYRDRLSREMHDGIQASLTELAARLALAQRAARDDPVAAARVATAQIHLVGQVSDELRCLVNTLREPPDTEHGFADRVRDYLKVTGARHSVQPSLDIQGAAAPMPDEVEHAAFRVLQESLTNVEKHAAAEQVKVTLRYAEARFELEVQDDGVGFDPSAPVTEEVVGEHLGLQGMRWRAECVGGTLRLCGSPGQGTRVLLSVPLSPPHAPSQGRVVDDCDRA